MKTIFEIQETKPKDLDNNYEAQQLNEYLNSDTEWKQVSDSIDDPEEVRWVPVAKPHIEENEDVDAFPIQPNPMFLKMLKQRGR